MLRFYVCDYSSILVVVVVYMYDYLYCCSNNINATVEEIVKTNIVMMGESFGLFLVILVWLVCHHVGDIDADRMYCCSNLNTQEEKKKMLVCHLLFMLF